MQIVINKSDSYINDTLLADQIGMSLHGFFKLNDVKESIEHINILTGNKEKYQSESPWNNMKEVLYISHLVLELVAIKVKDCDFQDKDVKK